MRSMFACGKCLLPSSSTFLSINLNHTRHKQPRNPPLILHPSLPVLLSALLNIPDSSMHNHTSEKQRVKPRKRRIETGDCTPRKRKEEVAGVVDFAGFAICGTHESVWYPKSGRRKKEKKEEAELTPPITQNRITSLCLDGHRVLDRFPG